MHSINRSALVPFAAEKMYRLVADISRYPEFLKWCGAASVLQDSGDEVVAAVTIDFKGVNKSFTTRNVMHPYREIEMSLVEGPFSHLVGKWRFTVLEDHASKIELDMQFDFDSQIISALVAPVFSYIANHQVDAFYQRARDLDAD